MLVAVHAEMHVESLARAQGPDMVNPKVLGDSLLKTAGCRALEEVIEELVQVSPGHDCKASLNTLVRVRQLPLYATESRSRRSTGGARRACGR